MRKLMWFTLGFGAACALCAYFWLTDGLWIPALVMAAMFVGAASVGSVKVLTVKVPGADAGKLRQMGDVLRDKDDAVVAVLASVNGEKVTFLAVCGKEAIAKGVKAGDLVKQVCTACGGSGGGKPDSAMGGGKDPTKVDNALALVDDFIASKVN